MLSILNKILFSLNYFGFYRCVCSAVNKEKEFYMNVKKVVIFLLAFTLLAAMAFAGGNNDRGSQEHNPVIETDRNQSPCYD